MLYMCESSSDSTSTSPSPVLAEPWVLDSRPATMTTWFPTTALTLFLRTSVWITPATAALPVETAPLPEIIARVELAVALMRTPLLRVSRLGSCTPAGSIASCITAWATIST